MASSYDDHQGNSHLDYSPEHHNNNTNSGNNKNLSLEYGKTIRLLRNGDEHYAGQKIVINSRKYRYFDVFLDDLSNTLNARFGAVRNIHTPLHGHKVKSLDQIEDGKVYVASGVSRFKKMNYLEIAEGRKPPNRLPAINRREVPHYNDANARPLFEKTNNVIIFVYRNGDVLTPPVKVLLYKHTLTSFEAILNEITQKVQLQNGAVLKLYTMDGASVTEPQQLETGHSYVATNKERFKRCEYFSPEDFGFSPRAIRKAEFNNTNSIEIGQRKMWLPVNSQPASLPSSIASSGKPRYSGKPYQGWHPTKDEIFSAKPQHKLKNPPFVKPIDVDKDDGGIYKARKKKEHQDIKEIPDGEDMIVDLPVDRRKAEEIHEEIYDDKQYQKGQRKDSNNPEFQQYKPPQNQSYNNNSKKPPSPTNQSNSPIKRGNEPSNHQNHQKLDNSKLTPVTSSQNSQKTYNMSENALQHDNDLIHEKYDEETYNYSPSNRGKYDTSHQSSRRDIYNDEKKNNKQLDENEAATKIQASYRGYKVRKVYGSDKSNKNNNSSINHANNDSQNIVSETKEKSINGEDEETQINNNMTLESDNINDNEEKLFKWYLHDPEDTN